MKVAFETDRLMGIFATREGAEEAAMKYMEESYYSWTPDNLYGKLPLFWFSDMDSSLVICDEEVLP